MGTPNYPRDLASEWQKLRRDVKGAYTSANMRTGMAKIGARVIEITGELILNAGAKLAAKYENGVEAFTVRKAYLGEEPVGEVVIRRYDGTAALEVFGGPNEPGYFAINDQSGNIILSDDGATRQGLARPYLSYTFARTSILTVPQDLTTSSSFVPHATIMNIMQHPKLRVMVYVTTNGSDVAQVRIKAGSGVVATSGNVTNGWLELTGSHMNYNFGDTFQYDVEIRRVSGSSAQGVGFTPVYAMGVQS
ncbi:hypothetical protein ACIBPB_30460 [Micromonospora sp. NPDC049836]|uniref:hypothetical protein n=1 Tax=Micromonospora sp. NPDC049836 TaxID=3364274 RepID=UPI0037A98379